MIMIATLRDPQKFAARWNKRAISLNLCPDPGLFPCAIRVFLFGHYLKKPGNYRGPLIPSAWKRNVKK
jgi:hypothetical protein